MTHIGTYDENWQKGRCPELPEDFRFDFYNGAHPDLQVEGYLKGNEDVELVNLTPEGRIQFRLPGIRPTAIVSKSPMENADASCLTEEVRLNLDTLCLIPDEKRFYLVWRGGYSIVDLTVLGVEKVSICISMREFREKGP